MSAWLLNEFQQDELPAYTECPLFDPSVTYFVDDDRSWYSVDEEPVKLPEPAPAPKRLTGNNPYGSRGCASCITCRKRKGKVLRNPSLLITVYIRVEI
jgi:hypothetical protein